MTGTLDADVRTFIIITRWIILRMRNASDKTCIYNKNIILCSVTFSWKSCCLWDNVVKYGSATQATGDITGHKRFACFISKGTGTHKISNAYCFPQQQCWRGPASMWRSFFTVCLVIGLLLRLHTSRQRLAYQQWYAHHSLIAMVYRVNEAPHTR